MPVLQSGLQHLHDKADGIERQRGRELLLLTSKSLVQQGSVLRFRDPGTELETPLKPGNTKNYEFHDPEPRKK